MSVTVTEELTADDHPDLFADTDAERAELEAEIRGSGDWREAQVLGAEIDPEDAVEAVGQEAIEERAYWKSRERGHAPKPEPVCPPVPK